MRYARVYSQRIKINIAIFQKICVLNIKRTAAFMKEMMNQSAIKLLLKKMGHVKLKKVSVLIKLNLNALIMIHIYILLYFIV